MLRLSHLLLIGKKKRQRQKERFEKKVERMLFAMGGEEDHGFDKVGTFEDGEDHPEEEQQDDDDDDDDGQQNGKKKKQRLEERFDKEMERTLSATGGEEEQGFDKVATFEDWEEHPEEEQHHDDDNDDDDGQHSDLQIRIKSHAACMTPECDYKLQHSVQAYPGVAFSEYSTDMSRMTIRTSKEVREDVLKEMVFDKSQRRVDFHSKGKTCDKDRNDTEIAKSMFNVNQFKQFFESFQSKVPNFSDGKWGNLYEKALPSIVRIVVGCEEEDSFESCGTGCIVSRTENFALIMSCEHIFDNMNDLELRVRVITSEFTVHEASILYRPMNLDFCVLRIEGDLSEYLQALELQIDPPNYGQDLFAISVPYHKMLIPEELEEDPTMCLKVNALWFPISLGYTSSPKIVGFESNNLDCCCIFLHMDGLDNGSSGCPIIDDKLRVVGVFNSTTSNDGATLGSWALRLDFVNKHLQEEFAEVADGNLTLKSILETLFYPEGEKNSSKT